MTTASLSQQYNHLPLKKRHRRLCCCCTPKIDINNANNLAVHSNKRSFPDDDAVRPSKGFAIDVKKEKDEEGKKFVNTEKATNFDEFLADFDKQYGMKVVIKKRLEASDIDCGQNRLSMPRTQIISSDFLTDFEKEMLKNHQKIQVKVRGYYSVKDHNMQLARWNYHQKKGSNEEPGYRYVLNNGWNTLRTKNALQKDDVVQVVSFRSKGHLCLAVLGVNNVLSIHRGWGRTRFRSRRINVEQDA